MTGITDRGPLILDFNLMYNLIGSEVTLLSIVDGFSLIFVFACVRLDGISRSF